MKNKTLIVILINFNLLNIIIIVLKYEIRHLVN